MPSIGYCLHRPPKMVTVCRLWGFSGGTDNQKRWINNIEKKQDFKLVAPSNLTPLLLFKPFWWEGSNVKVIFASWTLSMQHHGSTIRLVQRIYNAPFSYISYSEASLSHVKKWTKNPLINDAQSFFKNWPLIMSPSDHFMAANVVFVVTFQFLFYFLAQVATKNRALAIFYGVLNSICYFGCFFMLRRKPILLCCVVGID